MFACLLRKRRLRRSAAALLFLGGTVVFPALHQAFHDLDHDHIGGAIHFRPGPPAKEAREVSHTATAHRHADGSGHTHAPSGAHENRARGSSLPGPEPTNRGDSDPAHGDGALAHFSYAIGEDAPPTRSENALPLVSAPAVKYARVPAPRLGFFRPPPVRGPPAR